MKYIFDFDSTFVKTEGLEELAVLALARRSDKEELIKQIEEITNQGMNGEIGFTESLKRRLAVIPATRYMVDELAEILKTQVSDSVARNQKFFVENRDQIYIFSGGFKDFILPVLLEYGLRADHVFANTFRYDESGRVIGFDEDNFLSQENGKAKQLRKICLAGEICAVGDGWSDYEMKLSGGAHHFVAFTENVRREKVVAVADKVVRSLEEILGNL